MRMLKCKVLFACLVVQGGLSSFLSAQDPTRAFQFLDEDADGYVNRAELGAIGEFAPAFRANSFVLGRMFQRLDANGDQKLSEQEFAAIIQLRERGRFQRPQPMKMEAEKDVDGGGLPNPKTNAKPLNAEESVAFFEREIRPLLATHCYECHSAADNKFKGGLAVDTAEGLRVGGDSGAAVVPGDLDASLLWNAVTWTDYQMPPRGKLAGEDLANLKRWIEIGAPDPRVVQPTSVTTEIDIEAGKDFWAFQPPRTHTVPAVNDKSWASSDVDHFVLEKLESHGMAPASAADAATLLRRLSFDLIGLPPSPEEILGFVSAYESDADAAYRAKVDELLESEQFGERWGRHWLDVARYAESTGKEVNMTFPHAWRYRDYVIDAFNADKPYDQFVREQVAGDLLEAATEAERQEQLIATGFLALGTKSLNERNARQFELDVADEQIDTTTQAFLGLTVACARCHDHKIDPIPTTDYYALSGIFQSTQTLFGTVNAIPNRRGSDLVELSLVDSTPIREFSAREIESMRDRLNSAKEQLRENRMAARANRGGEDMADVLRNIRLVSQVQSLTSQLEEIDEDGTLKSLAMGVRDENYPTDARVLVRGELDKPAQEVPRGLVQVLCSDTRDAEITTTGSGRLELAYWLSSSENPLTSRVMVNRIWQHLFDRPIVMTPNNFGASGQLPSHPELLDHLAIQFVESGWSVKSMIRMLVNSSTYKMSSTYDPSDFEKDPDNALLWRMNPKALEAEAIRDALLAASGELSLDRPVGSLVAQVGDTSVGRRFNEAQINQPMDYRSVYLPMVRDALPDSLAVFDPADANIVSGKRESSVVPRQALYLMNNSFVLSQSQRMAERIIDHSRSPLERIQYAYLLAYGREATQDELTATRDFVQDLVAQLRGQGQRRDQIASMAYASVCQALIASAEFRFLN